MGLAASQIMLLTLTSRKADVEYDLAINTGRKMALTNEMSELSSEYYSRLKSKNLSYYANGKYNKIDYKYLMGKNYYAIAENLHPVKSDNSMILTDYNGRVVLSNEYAGAILSTLGNNLIDSSGKGGTFSKSNIAKILANLFGNPEITEENIQKVIDNEELSSGYYADSKYTMSGTDTGRDTYIDNSKEETEWYKKIVDFYYPIFAAAAANGWTTEYNKQMEQNEDYISDALVSGFLQLATVNEEGDYHENDSLSYFITAGMVESRTDSDVREEVTAWYNAEKERINQKETLLDLQIDELSTELEAIKVEMQSIKSFIDDAVQSVFDWGSGG